MKIVGTMEQRQEEQRGLQDRMAIPLEGLLLGGSCCAPVDLSGSPPAGTRPGLAPSQPRSSRAAYQLRPVGGSPAQCTGKAGAPYTGASQECACEPPHCALPPGFRAFLARYRICAFNGRPASPA